jgi:predicted nucleic acid-binding protein
MNTMDADVCIDVVRKRPKAIAWLDTLTALPAIPGFVAMELLAGCQSAQEYRYNLKFLQGMTVVWATEAAMQQTINEFLPFKLSHGIGVLDCLIAATAHEQGGTLYTFNTRHFRHLPGIAIAEPYTRLQP